MRAEACAIATLPSRCWRARELPQPPRWSGNWTRSGAPPAGNCGASCGNGKSAASRASGGSGWGLEIGRTQHLKWDERAGVAANARRELPRMVRAYFSRVRAFLAEDRTPRKLHRLRLASKRLRYTLELFRPCYPPGLEDRLDALKVLQDLLGEVNDAVATAEMLRGALKHQPKARKFLEERAAEHAAGFARHWKETFDASGQEVWWTGFLARPVKQTVPHKSLIHKCKLA